MAGVEVMDSQPSVGNRHGASEVWGDLSPASRRFLTGMCRSGLKGTVRGDLAQPRNDSFAPHAFVQGPGL